jgi:hypothetical protein
MKRVVLVSMSAVSLVVLSALTAAAAEEKWVSLFDGKTLSGWVVKSGFAKYRAEDGAIVGSTVEGSPNTFLCTEKNYGDFILEFEVNDDPRLNSGVQFRSHTYPKETTLELKAANGKQNKRTFPAGRVYGYQVEIANEAAGTSGGIYDEARGCGWLADITKDPAASKAFKDNQWNKYRIECRGSSIKTWVNGVHCANLTDSSDASGFIGLQVHQIKTEKPLEVRFRNLRIQELSKPAGK